MAWGSISDSYCNIARSLSIVGDRWTLLILREIAMGVRRFEEIQAQTGMSSHLLATRLRRLEEDKILERRVYNARPLRHEYYATARGKDLDAVVLALRNWDLRWGGSDGRGAAAAVLTDKRTGEVIDGTWHNPTGETFTFDNCETLVSDAWKAEREANLAAYYANKKSSVTRRAESNGKPVAKASRTAVTPIKSKKTVATKKAAKSLSTSKQVARINSPKPAKKAVAKKSLKRK